MSLSISVMQKNRLTFLIEHYGTARANQASYANRVFFIRPGHPEYSKATLEYWNKKKDEWETQIRVAAQALKEEFNIEVYFPL